MFPSIGISNAPPVIPPGLNPCHCFDDISPALAFGLANIDEAVLQNPKNIKGFDAVDYLKNKISYNLSEEKKLGLKKFLELM